MPSARYTFGFHGSMHLLRHAGEVQAETVEPFFENGDWLYDPDYFEQIPALFERRQQTALAGLEIAGVVVGFIGTWFAKKILDEVYERTLKRPIGAQLDKLFEKVEIPAEKTIEYRDVIYLEDIDLVVVIRAIASKDAGQAIQNQVMQAHRVAYSYIEQHGRKGPIHCHKIIDGSITAVPELFSTLEEINQHDRSQIRLLGRR
ncbi:hypothetical protein ACTJKJ_20395 [Roseateles sp. 22389]|uniref:hypothetical protein n=1 Tax=Roseateles sp. 22389 TaxID=3453916 RepID=UPI003F87303F